MVVYTEEERRADWDGWKEGWMDGWMDGEMDGEMDGSFYSRLRQRASASRKGLRSKPSLRIPHEKSFSVAERAGCSGRAGVASAE